MTDDTRPWVVLLTGGALPGQPAPEPCDYELKDVHEKATTAWRDAGAPNGFLTARMIAEAYKAGYERAAKDYKVRGVYLIDGTEELAARFQDWLTGEVDPAYRRPASSPLAALLDDWQAEDGD